MIDHEPRRAALLGLLEHQPDLADVQMAGGKHHVVPGDDVEDFLDLIEHAAVARRRYRDRRPHLLGRGRMRPG